MERPPPTILAAAAAAFLVALFDIVDTVLAMMSPEGTGRVFGTFLRDGVLVLAGAFLLRRASWALWTLVVLFALSLLRAISADEWIEYAAVVIALGGLIVVLMPPSREWVAAKASLPA